MAITTINRASLETLRGAINAALREVATAHGVALSVGAGQYGGATGNLKIEIAVGDASADAGNLKAAADWGAYASMFGLQPEWLGQTVTLNGRTCKIIGLLPKRHKFPVLVLVDGREKLYTSDGVCSAFALQALRTKVAA